MEKIKKILDDVKFDEVGGMCTITDVPETPTEDLAFLYILMGIQSHILCEEGLSFPTRMDHFEVHIEPNKENIERNAFSLEGIMEQINYFNYKLMYDKSFMKTQVMFRDDETLPTLVLYFFSFNKVTGTYNVSHESILYPLIFQDYPKDFINEERIKVMESHGINAEFIKYLPITNLCPIHFNDNGQLLTLEEYEKNRNHWER